MSVNDNLVNVTYGIYNFPNLGTPYVTRAQEVVYYGEKWCQVTRITLKGELLGTYNEITTARLTLESNFATDFLDLKITEKQDSSAAETTIALFPKCVVKSLDFDSFNYGAQSYSITLESYEEENFIGTYGVLDPEDTFDYSEDEQGFVSITHKVSARGIRTGSPAALIDALNYVDARTGFNSVKITPKFIAGISASNAVLTNISRSINRVDSSYSVEENYQVQTGDIYGVALNPGFLTTIDSNFTSGFSDEYSQINVKYSIQGDKYATASSIRAAIPTTGTLYSIASDAYGGTNIAQRPRNYSVDDNALTTKRISLTCDFTDNTFADIDNAYYDFTSSLSTDNVSNETTVSLQGKFQAIGPIKNKYAAVSGYYYDTIAANQDGVTGFSYGIAKQIYEKTQNLRDGVDYKLSRIPESISVNDNFFEGTISLQARFTDKDGLNKNSETKPHFHDSAYSVSVTPSINTYSARPSCNKNGLYGVYNLNSATREKTSINGNFSATGAKYDTTVASFIDALRMAYVQGGDLIVSEESINEVPSPYFNVEYAGTYDTSNLPMI